MVQVLPAVDRGPSTSENFTQAIRGLSQLGGAYLANKRQQEAAEIEDQALQRQGIDLRGIRNPEMRKYLAEASLKKKELDFKEKINETQREQEDEALRAAGIAIPKGIKDTRMRQQYVAEALKGKRQEERYSHLSGLIGQNQGKESEVQDMVSSDKYNLANLPQETITQIAIEDPQLAKVLQHQKDVAQREGRSEREFEFQKQKASPEYQRENQLQHAQAQADVKYNQQLEEASKQHALKEQTLNRLEVLNKKGVTGKPYEKLLEKIGLVNLTSEGRREFAADVKNLITDIRSILGAQFTGFEFQTILNAYPSADFSKDANDAIIRNLKDFQDIKSKEVEFARQLKKENKGKIPEDFQSQVNEKVHEYAQSKLPSIKENARKIMNAEYGIKEGNTLMLDPKGEPLSVPLDQIEHYINLGASLP